MASKCLQPTSFLLLVAMASPYPLIAMASKCIQPTSFLLLVAMASPYPLIAMASKCLQPTSFLLLVAMASQVLDSHKALKRSMSNLWDKAVQILVGTHGLKDKTVPFGLWVPTHFLY